MQVMKFIQNIMHRKLKTCMRQNQLIATVENQLAGLLRSFPAIKYTI